MDYTKQEIKQMAERVLCCTVDVLDTDNESMKELLIHNADKITHRELEQLFTVLKCTPYIYKTKIIKP